MDVDTKRPGGAAEGNRLNADKGEGGQKLAKSCGRLL